MLSTEHLLALAGGGLIGIASVALLLLNGRIFGISGIIYGLLNPAEPSKHWRVFLLLGLLLGGPLASMLFGVPLTAAARISPSLVFTAGILVGFGAVLGTGCTSGHGVCGLGRLAPRSLLATITFIASGMVTVHLLKNWGWL